MARKKPSFFKGISVAIILLCFIALLTSCAKAPETTIEGVDITINFEVNGSIFHTLNLNTQGEIKLPTAPSVEGYIFSGWFLEKDTFTKKLTNYSIRSSKESFTVYAFLEHKECTGEWHIVEQADCIKAGLRQNICKYCGKVLESEVIAALGHTIEDGETACSVCHEENPSTVGLSYAMNESFTGYLLTGMGTATEKDIIIAENYNGMPVTGIAPNAFLNNTVLTSVYFTSKVYTIGESAFSGCTNLNSLTLPNSLRRIEKNAFYQCNRLTQITVPSKVNFIGEGAFASSANLADVTFLSTELKSLPDKLFYSCPRLTSIAFPLSLERIGKETFSLCIRLTDIALPENLISLGERAFAGCTILSQIIINEKLQEIGSRAFLNCGQLSEIVLPNSVKEIGEDAFFNCAEIETLTLGASVAGVYGAPNVKNIVLKSNTNGKVRDNAFNGINSILSVTFCENVTKIGQYAFYNCINLSTITYNSVNNITEIGDYAFGNCAKITEYTFNNSITEIGEGAFIGCAKLVNITIPATISVIKQSAFSHCTTLAGVVLTDSITMIEENAFSGCTNLKTIIIPESVEQIKPYAFSNTGLINITLAENIALIENSVFSNCKDLTTVNASFANAIKDNAFYNCISLSDITFHQDLLEIGSYAFYNCDLLTEFSIGSKVNYLGDGVFAFCDNLTAITVDENNAYYAIENMVLYGYSGDKVYHTLIKYMPQKIDTDYVIPQSVTKVADYAFDKCNNLKTLSVPDRVNLLGYQNITAPLNVYLEKQTKAVWSANLGANSTLFWNCNKDKANFTYELIGGYYTVTSFIGSGINAAVPIFYQGILVKGIGQDTFKNCTNLNSIYIHSKIDNIALGAFNGCNSLYYIDVEVSNSAYLSQEGVLFDKGKINLIKYPANKFDKVYFLPNTVTDVNDYAFEKCQNLESLIVHQNIMHMGVYSPLSSMYIYSELRLFPDIWDESWLEHPVMFDYDKNQADFTYELINDSYAVSSYNGNTDIVYIPASYNGIIVNQVLANTFNNLNGKALLGIVIPNTVISIGDSAMQNCENLLAVSMPDSVEYLGEYSLSNLTSIKKMRIPSGVKHIPSYLLYGNTELSDITLSTGLISIGAHAFEGCAIQNITIPNSVEQIGAYAFSNCQNLVAISIPSKVTVIKEYTFNENILLSSVTLPSGLIEIKDSAFFNCQNLQIINLPASLQKIGAYAFANNNLSVLNLPERINTISDFALMGNKNITEIILPKYLQSIGNGVFEGNDSLARISFTSANDYFTSLDNVLYNKDKTILYVYAPAKLNTAFTLPESVLTITEGGFYGSKNLINITLNAKLESIGRFAFYNCVNLAAASLPNKINVINESVFENCVKLSSIIFSENITIIDVNAFRNCNITSLNLPSKLIEIRQGAFYGCTKLNTITAMPSTVTKIGIESFANCTSLNSIRLSRNLVEIGANAFENCAFSSIIIPVSVTKIGARVFNLCQNLTAINCENSTRPPKWDNLWKEGAPESAEVVWNYTA